MDRILSLLAVAMLLGGCSLSVGGPLNGSRGPSEGIRLLQAGHFHEAAEVFEGVIERSRRPGQLSVRGSVLGVLKGSESGSLALTETEEAVLLLLHGTALLRSGELELAATRARKVMARHDQILPEVRCWSLRLLVGADPSEEYRVEAPQDCSVLGPDFRLSLGRGSGPVREQVETERQRGLSLLESAGRMTLALGGVPTQGPPDWVPGRISTYPSR